MRLCVFEHNGQDVVGLRSGDDMVDLSMAAPDSPADIPGILALDAHGRERLIAAAAAATPDARQPATKAHYRVPLPRPGKILCLGLNYADHAKEGGHERPAYPSFFMRGATSLVAHGEAILRPRASEQLDYEAELVAIIGRRARHVSRDKGLEVISGYSCFNDASIRDYQRLTSQWTIGKNFDGTGAFGPEVVSADELPPGAEGLRICSRLNGEVLQDANTRDMLFGVAETVALVSQCMTLEVGDLLVMGTPAGVGHARRPPLWMKPGDVCEIEIEGVGILRNPIAEEP